jgi:hypothetical protein
MGFHNAEHLVKRHRGFFTRGFETFQSSRHAEGFEIWCRSNQFVNPIDRFPWMDREQVGHAALVMKNPRKLCLVLDLSADQPLRRVVEIISGVQPFLKPRMKPVAGSTRMKPVLHEAVGRE